MISKFVREQERYTQDDLRNIFECTDKKLVIIIKKLKEYGILKTVKANDIQKDMSELINEDIEVVDVVIGDNEYLYVFTYVGIIIVSGCVLKCYPKYIIGNIEPKNELKQIIKVLEKYNSKEQIVSMYSENDENSSFNLLAISIYLLNDYYENGIYTNTQDIIEVNGLGEILWDKTINETFTFLSNNRPFYTELFTKKRTNDDYDFFKRLHECILSKFSNDLAKADLLDLFDITPIELSDEELQSFGDDEYICYRIEKELNIQFNTRKQLVLKAIYAYISHKNNIDIVDSFSTFGTNSFNLVWEDVCKEVMDNQLNNTLGSLKLPINLNSEYKKEDTLISIIEKPKWVGKKLGGDNFEKTAKATLIPGIISISSKDSMYNFVIFDAKYYKIQLEANKPLKGQPGITDITKQYLYQLAYKKFIELHSFDSIKNCFLMPTQEKTIINSGYAYMEMFNELELENIQIKLMPAVEMYDNYLTGKKINISRLNL